MATPQPPSGTDEDSPERTADYHRGADNTIKEVTRAIMDNRRKQGGELSGVRDQDLDEVEDPATGKSKPETKTK
jgi:hypothetical protein